MRGPDQRRSQNSSRNPGLVNLHTSKNQPLIRSSTASASKCVSSGLKPGGVWPSTDRDCWSKTGCTRWSVCKVAMYLWVNILMHSKLHRLPWPMSKELIVGSRVPETQNFRCTYRLRARKRLPILHILFLRAFSFFFLKGEKDNIKNYILLSTVSQRV